MTDKKRLFLVTLIFLQTACNQNPVRQPTPIKTPPQPQVSRPKSTVIKTVSPKNEPVRVETIVEDIPIEKPVVSAPERTVETKPSPALSPAAQSLLANADKNIKAGDLDSASVMLERALRISPRNAELTYQLAALRLKQSQPRLAEDLGKKAAFLAADDRQLKKRCWLLIAEARELQGNSEAAKEAQLKADSLE